MASDRIQRQLDRLLDEAEEAMAKDDWATVISRAKAVLAIDPENGDGQAYLAASERALGASGAATASDAASAPVSITPPATGPYASFDTSKQGTELPSGLITYLFTDVQGSTPLWQQHPQEMNSVMARHDDLMTSAVESNGGTVWSDRGAKGTVSLPSSRGQQTL